jgi:hypothetical protein
MRGEPPPPQQDAANFVPTERYEEQDPVSARRRPRGLSARDAVTGKGGGMEFPLAGNRLSSDAREGEPNPIVHFTVRSGVLGRSQAPGGEQ